MSKYYNLFYVGNMKNALNKTYAENLPKMTSFIKIKNNDYIDFSNPEYRMHKHDNLEIFYFISGKGFFETENGTIPIKENTLLVVNSSVLHRQYSTCKPPLMFYNINFSSLNLENVPENCISNNDYEVHVFSDKKNKVYSLFSALQKDTLKSDLTFLALQSRAFLLLDEITQVFIKSKSSSSPKKNKDLILSEIQFFIMDNYEIKITLDELSKKFFISKSRLSHDFKKEFGVSPIEYLIDVRLKKAETLLSSSNKTITDIALETGFSNTNYFSDFFRKKHGVSPLQYRKNSMKK